MPETPGERTRRVWADLGAGSALRELVREPDPRFGFDPVAMRALLAGLDTRAGLGAALSVCVQVSNAIPLLLAAAKGPGALAVAEQALDGRVQLAVAATDGAAAGSDLTGLATAVTADGDGLELSGSKHWIVNALTADWALVLARHAPGRQFTSFTLLLVPLDLPGITRRPADSTAFDGAGLGDLVFDRVRLDPDCVLGGRGRGLALFARQLAGERLAGALWAEALAVRALAGVRSHLERRTVADVPLWQNPAVRHRFAGALVEQQRLAALCEQLARPGAAQDGSELALARAAVLKAATALGLERILGDCCQLMGAEGYRQGGIQDLRREAAMFGIAGGSLATMLDVISDHSGALLGAAPTGVR